MSKKLFVSLLVSFILLSNITCAFAGTKDLSKEYTFYTDDKNFSYEENQTITENGQKYKAVKTEYELIENNTPKELKKNYENVTLKDIKEELKENDVVYKLKEKKVREKTVTHTDTILNAKEESDFPMKADFTVGEKSVEGIRTSVEHYSSDSLDTPFTISAKFYGDEDCMFYELNGKRIPSTNAPLFNGYEKELLEYLDLDGNDYRVDTGSWNGTYYNDNNRTVRNATFTGMKRGTFYTATYEGKLYDADVTYVEVRDKNVKNYKVKATITYEKDGLSSTQKIIIGSVAVLVIAVAIAIILMIMRKKKPSEKETEEK